MDTEAPQELASAFARSPAPQAVLTRGGRFLRVNEAFRRLVGLPDDHPPPAHVVELLDPADSEAFGRRWAEALGDRGTDTIDVFRWLDFRGHTVPVRLHVAVVGPDAVHLVAERIAGSADPAGTIHAAMGQISEGLSSAVMEVRFDGAVQWVSTVAQQLLGDRTNLPFAGLLSNAHPEDVSRVREAVAEVLAARHHSVAVQFRMPLDEKGMHHLEARLVRTWETRPPTLFIRLQDITDQVQTEALLAAQERVLQLIAHGEQRSVALHTITGLIELLEPQLTCSIMVPTEDGTRLRTADGGSLPREYVAALGEVPIGPGEGSCGTAAYRKTAVVVSDVRENPLWRRYRRAAEESGFLACWSFPLLGPEDRVLGTFVLYHSRPRRPTDQQLWLIERISSLAAAVLAAAPSVHPLPEPGLLDGLTARQREILALIAVGHTNAEIGRALGISTRTVEAHRSAITSRLGVGTRADLVRLALRAGLLTGD